MSFAKAYAVVAALAAEYTNVRAGIGGMACAADHDSSWGAADDAKLADAYARQSELAQELADAFVALEHDHGAAWRELLRESTERLGLLSRDGESGRIQGEYEHDQWALWSRGALPKGDQPEIFARGLSALEEHRERIDRLVREARDGNRSGTKDRTGAS